MSCSAGQCSFPLTSCAPGWTHCSSNVAQGCETNESSTSSCGGCGVVCPSTAPVCSGSGSSYSCVTGCPTGTPTLCSGTCVDTTSNEANCATCGNACPAPTGSGSATCAQSQCGYSCNLGYHLCGTDCADNTSVSSCGQSCTPCSLPNAVPVCASGACAVGQCTAPYMNCDGVSSNGCEADTNTDPNHCGSCAACSVPNATAACNGGTCAIAQCNSGYGDCNNNATDGCETNVLGTDASNCGACGHGCLGGTCVAGQCQPVALATAQPYPGQIVVNNGVVYWVNQGPPTRTVAGAIMSIHSDGTGQQTLSSHYEVDALSNDATTIYFTGYDNDAFGYKVFKVLMTGGTTTTLVKSRSYAAKGISNDAAYVYWSEWEGGTVLQASLVDGSSLATLETGQAYPYAIAMTAWGLYWVTNPISGTTGGSIWHANEDGTGAAQFVAPATSALVSGFALDSAGNLFYQTYSQGIWRVAANGSGNAQISTGGFNLYVNMVTDTANVYWLGDGSSNPPDTIYCQGLNGTHPRTNDILLANQSVLGGVAVDASYVYFTTSGSSANNYLDGAVYRVAK